MRIGPVSPHLSHTVSPASATHPGHAAHDKSAVEHHKTHRALDSEKPRGEVPAEKGRARGVLRLLEEGHFKGVADVRLRINFHEEITQRQTALTKETAHEGVGSVVEAVATPLEALLDTDQVTEDQASLFGDLLATFKAEAEEAEATLQASEKPDVASLTEALQHSFDTLFTAIEGHLNPKASPENEAPTASASEVNVSEDASSEGDVVVAEGDEPLVENYTPSSDFLDQLAEAFTGAIEALRTSAETLSVLPPLSEPDGQGKAYAKFVAQYNQLQAAGDVTAMAGVDFSV